MIKRKALSTIVGNVLVIMLVIIAAGIFLSVYLRSVRDIADRDLPLCTGIDLRLVSCYLFPPETTFQGAELITYGLYFIVERGPGDGEIRDLRFKVIDINGAEHIERPINITGTGINTNYKFFAEHSTVEAAVVPIVYLSGVSANDLPDFAAVSVVVGDSNTVCSPTSEPIKCLLA